MKRSQIQRHRLVWLLIGPVLIGTIVMAMNVRPDPDLQLNDELPSFLED